MKNLVIALDNQAITTSLKVAEAFNKRHKDVIERIEQTIEDLRKPKIRPSLETAEISRFFTYTQQNLKMPKGGIKQNGIYTMTRDGFTLLAMGFTGKKALQFKLSYIDAFNRMEATLNKKSISVTSYNRRPPSPRAATPARLSEVDISTIAHLVKGYFNTEVIPVLKSIQRSVSNTQLALPYQSQISTYDAFMAALKEEKKKKELYPVSEREKRIIEEMRSNQAFFGLELLCAAEKKTRE